MRLKIKDKTYDTIRVPNYNRYISMLETLFMSNPKKFKYHGIIDKGILGILVCGTDKLGVREFEKFYPIRDIHFYFDRHVKNIITLGERRLR